MNSFWRMAGRRKLAIAGVIAPLLLGTIFAMFESRLRLPGSASFTSTAGGCGALMVWRFDDSRRLSIEVRLDDDKLPEDAAELHLSIKDDVGYGLAVDVVQYARRVAQNEEVYCTDAIPWIREKVRWKGVSGEVVVRRDRSPPPDAFRNATQKVSIELRDVTFQREGGEETSTVKSVDFENVWVGWSP